VSAVSLTRNGSVATLTLDRPEARNALEPGMMVELRDLVTALPLDGTRVLILTGAGDTFLAALQASVLRPAIVGRRRSRHRLDLRFAAAAGSLVVEGPGLDGVPDRAAVLVRRARERIRRAVLPSEVTQVGVVGPP
jgi:bifunctional ADP-heptose synthase (sugar kinase/adenylyltransferase)